jgi:hypothetical protein
MSEAVMSQELRLRLIAGAVVDSGHALGDRRRVAFARAVEHLTGDATPTQGP